MNVPAALLALLRERMGLDPEILGAAQIERAWTSAAKKHSSDGACLSALLCGGEAWGELLDQLVVPETWFFRQESAFAHLKEWLRAEWMPRHPMGVLHVLSLPCATGEEAYSAAIAALDAGIPAGRVRVEARDISPRAIGAGERGIYRGRAVRLVDERTAKHYFHAEGGVLRVNAVLRACTHFKIGNLLHAADHGVTYPVVFCRNLLIYLTSEARRTALRNIQRALSSNGLLFLGHADTISGLDEFFERLPVDGAFAYRHRAEAVQQTRRVAPRERGRSRSRLLPALLTSTSAAKPSPRKESPRESVSRAQELADRGNLAEARALLLKALKVHGDCAEGWYLLGLVQAALGHTDEAALCYERTLSLQPEHRDASLHHALLHGENKTGGAV